MKLESHSTCNSTQWTVCRIVRLKEQEIIQKKIYIQTVSPSGTNHSSSKLFTKRPPLTN